MSIACMLMAIILVINNLQLISGSDSPLIRFIPWFIACCACADISCRRSASRR
jgi:hypothetical protein